MIMTLENLFWVVITRKVCGIIIILLMSKYIYNTEEQQSTRQGYSF